MKIRVGPPIITINQGDMFLVSRLNGYVEPKGSLGFFARDTRFVSAFQITINQRPWELINSANLTYYASRIVLGNPDVRTLEGPLERSQLSLIVERALGEGIHEDIDITNHGMVPARFFLEIYLASDFADVFDVKTRKLLRRARIDTQWNSATTALESSYRRGDFERGFQYRITKASSTPHYANGQIVFEVSLEPGETWHTCGLWCPTFEGVLHMPVYGCGQATTGPIDTEMERRQHQWQQSVTVLKSASPDVEEAYARSIEDIGALRLYHRDVGSENELWIPAAGIPWFAALFGRDSLITALQTMMVAPDLAQGVLHHVAEYQATDLDDWRDSEPGKIPHELRAGELVYFKEVPHTPYYGTNDATMLFVITLHEAFRWLGEEDLLRRHLDAARRAIVWIDEWGDLDDDGFVEYRTRSNRGLDNQGWKDSGDAVVDADGAQVRAPIALCEVQGYAYDAKMRMAEIEELVGEAARADRLRKEAAVLMERFNETFWMEDEGTYAFALGPDKEQVRSIVSNPGHCLWSGIVPEERAPRVARRLFEEDMWSGWGIRTLSASNPAYNPLSYQRGTVWPHDNAIIAAGFARYGFRKEANRVARALFDAASAFLGARLPELFAGFARTEPGFPLRYVGANIPQAWSAGAVFMLLQAILGLAPDATAGQLIVDPFLPGWLPRVELERLRVGDARVRLAIEGSGEQCEVQADSDRPLEIITRVGDQSI